MEKLYRLTSKTFLRMADGWVHNPHGFASGHKPQKPSKENGILRWVFELNFNEKIIASIFAIILTNVSVKTYTIISVKLHRH